MSYLLQGHFLLGSCWQLNHCSSALCKYRWRFSPRELHTSAISVDFAMALQTWAHTTQGLQKRWLGQGPTEKPLTHKKCTQCLKLCKTFTDVSTKRIFIVLKIEYPCFLNRVSFSLDILLWSGVLMTNYNKKFTRQNMINSIILKSMKL